jgi:DNA-binding transcriptional LysR family regulator
LEDGEIPFHVAAEVHELELLLHLVADGVGASVMAARLLPPNLPSLGLQTFEIPGARLAVETQLIFRNNSKYVPQLMALIGKVAEKALSSGDGGQRNLGVPGVGSRARAGVPRAPALSKC